MFKKYSVLMMLLLGAGSLIGISGIYQPANVETQPQQPQQPLVPPGQIQKQPPPLVQPKPQGPATQKQFESKSISPNYLTGIWRANDGGTYYLRQIGNILWWNGMSANDGRTFNNVFRGTVTPTTTITGTIDGGWMDVPRGTVMGQGTLSLKIVSPNMIQKVSQTGSGFGATTWQKIPDEPVVR